MGGSGMGGSGAGSGGSEPSGNVTGQCSSTFSGWPSYNGNGSVTFYTFGMGSNCQNTPPTNKCVNCGFPVTAVNPDKVAHAYTGEGRYFAAMNTTDFNNAAACGACVEVTRDGRKVVATVVDQCPISSNPKCTKGHIDLSKDAFLQVASESEGYVGTGNGGQHASISWKYVPCPVPDNQNVTLRLKEPDNAYYTAVIVQDHTYPIKSVKIKGQEATRDGRSNYWLVGTGNQAPGPWKVQATDVNGWGFEATLAMGQGGDVSTGHKVSCN
jgi:expansin